MTDQPSPSTAAAGGCCGPISSTPGAGVQPASAPAAVCCGSATAAAEADACCDPNAKTKAIADGASCCG